MVLSIGEQFAVIACGAALVMFVLWAIQIRTRDAGVVDVAWSALLAASAILAASTGGGDPSRRMLVGAIVGIWGFRLAFHLLFDRVLKGPEDGRYQMMRERFGTRVNFVFFWFFQAQTVTVVMLCTPFLLACSDERHGLSIVDIAGAALWLVGLGGESLADHQLARFKADPGNKAKVCTVGLWRYSRHPNYFFEWIMWCAYAVIALPGDNGWIGLASPLLILLFVLKLTGIPPTEARAIKTRGDAYRRYQETTSAFVPWFPKETAQ